MGLSPSDAGVDHGTAGPFGCQIRHVGQPVANDEQVGADRSEGHDRVFERLALGGRGEIGAEVHHMGTQAVCRPLEGKPRPGRCFEEGSCDRGPSEVARHRAADIALGSIEETLQAIPAQSPQADQAVLRSGARAAPVLSTHTPSSWSTGGMRTRTTSSWLVGRFLPT